MITSAQGSYIVSNRHLKRTDEVISIVKSAHLLQDGAQWRIFQLTHQVIVVKPAVRVFALLSALAAATYAADNRSPEQARSLAKIAVDYPSNGSIFPPDIIAPVFRWRD